MDKETIASSRQPPPAGYLPEGHDRNIGEQQHLDIEYGTGDTSALTRRPRALIEVLAIAVPVLVYIALAAPVTFHEMAAINPDGIIYIRKAEFLLEGRFWQSVSGYWSPAISWCVALLLRVHHKTEPLHAIHAVLMFWGFSWVLASCALLRSLLPQRTTTAALWRLLAGIALAFSGARQAVSLITPDLLLGTMLLAYLATVSTGRLMNFRRTAFFAGLWAGLGYLCKSYALPFFCLHFPLTVAYRYWSAKRGRKWNPGDTVEAIGIQKALATLLIGLLGFAIPALPWVGLISHKYGRFTVSMVYHHNHMNVAPKPLQEALPDFCVVPPDPYLSIWEGLDPGPRRDWSPLASWQNVGYQLEIVADHAWLIISNVAKFDYVGLVLAAVIVALLPFKKMIARPVFSAVPMWIVLSCVVYCLGFLIVAFEVRYIVPILFPLGIALCLREWTEFNPTPATDRQRLGYAIVPCAMIGLFCISSFWGLSAFLFDSPARPIYAQVAALLKRKHLDGLYTSSDNNKGVNVSYYLNRKIVLIPFWLDSQTIEGELAAAGVNEVLVWTDIRTDDKADSYPHMLTAELLQSGQWRSVLLDKIDTVRRVEVYLRKSPAHPATASTQDSSGDSR
jgi:hypothetical protein